MLANAGRAEIGLANAETAKAAWGKGNFGSDGTCSLGERHCWQVQWVLRAHPEGRG